MTRLWIGALVGLSSMSVLFAQSRPYRSQRSMRVERAGSSLAEDATINGSTHTEEMVRLGSDRRFQLSMHGRSHSGGKRIWPFDQGIVGWPADEHQLKQILAKVYQNISQVCDRTATLHDEQRIHNSLYPHTNFSFSRDIQKVLARLQRRNAMIALGLKGYDKGLKDVIAHRTYLDGHVAELENLFPVEDAMDGIASFSSVHFVDLENLIRYDQQLPLEAMDAGHVKEIWKARATQAMETYEEEHEAFRDPIEALTMLATYHAFIVHEQIKQAKSAAWR